MVAEKAKDVRADLKIFDDQIWENMLEDAQRIFEECGCHLQCKKLHGWKSVRDTDRAMARVKVISPTSIYRLLLGSSQNCIPASKKIAIVIESFRLWPTILIDKSQKD